MLTVQETAALLRRWDNVLILTHKRPDGDTIGSAAALCRMLRHMGKTAWLLKSEDATRLFHPYLEGCVAPEGFVPERVVSVDVADEGLLPPNAERYKGSVDLAIDHHPSHRDFSEHRCVQAERAACGEIIWELAQELGIMDGKIAEALYVAVSTDTGCFVYGNTTPHTHRVAAWLMEQGIETPLLNQRHFRTKSFKRLRLESAIVRDMELYQNGTVAVAPVSLKMMAEVGATEEDAEDIASFVGQLEGVLHAVTIRELRPGECKLSLRTDPKLLNASDVCARLGGGGHVAAAGCTVKGTVRESIDAILAAICAEQNG